MHVIKMHITTFNDGLSYFVWHIPKYHKESRMFFSGRVIWHPTVASIVYERWLFIVSFSDRPVYKNVLKIIIYVDTFVRKKSVTLKKLIILDPKLKK